MSHVVQVQPPQQVALTQTRGTDGLPLVTLSGNPSQALTGRQQSAMSLYSDPAFALSIPANTRTFVPMPQVRALTTLDRDHDFVRSDGRIAPIFGANETYQIRINTRVTSSVVGGVLEMDVDIDGTFDDIADWRASLAEDAGTPEKLSPLFPVFAGSTFLANGGGIFAQCGVPITLTGLTLFIEASGVI